MRYPIKISRPWRPLFALLGYAAPKCYLDLDDQAIHAQFGSAKAHIPLSAVAGVERRRWPWYYGLGAKLGPDGGVSYVASPEGVVKISLAVPQPLPVWGPFRASQGRCLVVSLEAPDQFVNDLKAGLRNAGRNLE